MNVSVTSSIQRISPTVCESIRTLMEGTLSRFNSRIAQVSVLVVDENGPRGGADKVCRINLSMQSCSPFSYQSIFLPEPQPTPNLGKKIGW